MRDADPLDARHARVSAADRGRRAGDVADARSSSIRAGRQSAGRSNPASSARLRACWSIRSSSSAFEREPPGVAGAAYRLTISTWRRGSRSFCGAAIPDDELRDAAVRGVLKEPAELERQVRRMLADPACRRARQQLRRAVALPARAEERPARLTRLRRQPAAARCSARRRLLFRTIVQRGSQRRRSARCRLHVRRRASGASLRDTGRPRIAHAPHLACRQTARVAGCSDRAASSRSPRRRTARRRSFAASGFSRTCSGRRRRSRRPVSRPTWKRIPSR